MHNRVYPIINNANRPRNEPKTRRKNVFGRRLHPIVSGVMYQGLIREQKLILTSKGLSVNRVLLICRLGSQFDNKIYNRTIFHKLKIIIK